MMSPIRPAPNIPDHEVLRKIGGGSYGEVYMARGVTGALRAVKVVWREDFDDDRTFEREFDGILKYEPLSRSHPGLVNLLHIGRSEEEGRFYYYVMELGDDRYTGAEVNPVEYVARTLLSDMRETPGEPLPVDNCLEVGMSLSGALFHMHSNGLAHRDVKPANVIFVEGKAKLADIGLVATAGGRSFVGTEGFVPPEGPGSEQADLYSLGKVLYEMASGKDRLDFPELPDDLPTGASRKSWLALNDVICDVCDPRLSQRKIRSASELREALEKIAGISTAKKPVGKWLLLLTLVLAAITLTFTQNGREMAGRGKEAAWDLLKEQIEEEDPLEGKTGLVKVQSQPENVAIYDSDGNLVGYTPYGPVEHPAGTTTFQLRLGGYSTEEVELFVNPGPKQSISYVEMRVEAPPVVDQRWTDAFGAAYGPEGDHHISYEPVRQWLVKKYEASSGRTMNAELSAALVNGDRRWLAVASLQEAERFTGWLTELCLANGLLTDEFIIEPVMDWNYQSQDMSENAKLNHMRPFKCKVYKYEFAELTLVTNPPGASVTVDGELLSRLTPTTLPYIVPGRFEVQVAADGYRPSTEVLSLKSGEVRTLKIELKSNKSVVFGKPWTNGLKMELLPVGEDLMVSRWETRRSDYAAYLEATGAARLPAPRFSQEDDHPVVNVTVDEARAFCDWLTERDREAELLSTGHRYRLPTDLEWSRMVGLDEDPTLTPAEREQDSRSQGLFVWGKFWVTETEPGPPVANLADGSLERQERINIQSTIAGYEDDFPFTAPVSAFPPNAYGLQNLAGNVHEWVDSIYDENAPFYVLRGGGWNTHQRNKLYTHSRNLSPPSVRSEYYGFRPVLVRAPVPSQADRPGSRISPFSTSQ